MSKHIDWWLKCPVCGFEFSILFPADESEENKKTLKECPCGCEEMNITRERIIEEAGNGKRRD